METTQFLAQFWGWLLVILSLLFLARPRPLVDEIVRIVEDKGYALLTGFIALIIGLASVVLHNEWSGGKNMVISLFGWLSLIKGVTRIGFPDVTRKVADHLKHQKSLIQLMLVITLVLGVWLIAS